MKRIEIFTGLANFIFTPIPFLITKYLALVISTTTGLVTILIPLAIFFILIVYGTANAIKYLRANPFKTYSTIEQISIMIPLINVLMFSLLFLIPFVGMFFNR